MYREFFAHSPLLALPMLSLVIFITVFTLVIVRTMRGERARDAAISTLPLDGGEVRS